MRICVLQSSYEESDSVFKSVDGYSEVKVHLPDHHVDQILVKKSNAVEHVEDLIKNGNYDVFINLCDGAEHEDRAGIEVVQTLEKHQAAFTGADSHFFDPSKEYMKRTAVQYGIRTPPFVFAYKEEEIEPATKLNYPLIVKHYNGSGSVGMTKQSKVNNNEELYEQAKKMIKEHGGALIEEFIEGKEYTVLVTENSDPRQEPIAFLPVECCFTNGEDFKHFELKWLNFKTLKWVASTDTKLNEKMKDLSRRIFSAMKGVGYGRTDLRVSKVTGEPYFLEINANCGIFSPPNEEGSAADFILEYDGIKHRGFAEHIIKVAVERSKIKRGNNSSSHSNTSSNNHNFSNQS